MESVPIKNPKPNSLISNSNSHSPTFLLPNGFGAEIEISDIEMITIQAVGYTSLRDLLPTSPPTIMSPVPSSSWHEIPIKNPLVKHAALAYLQPMSTPPEVGDKGFLRTIRDRGIDCFAWLGDSVLKAVADACGGGEEVGEEEDEDDDDDDEYVKVD